MAYLKILSFLLFLGIVQFSLASSSLNPEATTEILTPKEKLLDYYESELTKIYKEFCEKSKNISELILKDERIYNADTPILKEFKNNITGYLSKYENLKDNDMYKVLKWVFSNIIQNFNADISTTDADVVYIIDLLKKLDLEEINNDFEQRLNDLLDKKLLEKFEDNESSFKKAELIYDELLSDWYNHIKSCKDSECYKESGKLFVKMIKSPKEDLYEFILASLRDIYIFYGDGIKNISAEILNDASIKSINTPEIQLFKKNLTEFINKYNSYQDVYDIYDIVVFYSNILLKYETIPKEKLNSNAKLIVSVFKKFKMDALTNDMEHKFNEFINKKFIPKFDEYILKLNREMIQDYVLLLWFRDFKNKKTYGERKEAFVKLKDIFWQSGEGANNT